MMKKFLLNNTSDKCRADKTISSNKSDLNNANQTDKLSEIYHSRKNLDKSSSINSKINNSDLTIHSSTHHIYTPINKDLSLS